MSVLDLGYLKSELPKEPDLKTFFEMLRLHDWYFSMSDDYRVWKSGQNEHDQIMAICKQSQNMSGAKVTIALMESRRVVPILGCRRPVVLPAKCVGSVD